MEITMEENIDDIKASPKVETFGFEKQNHEDMPSDYEMLMVRRAITRSRLTAPDVDKEWNAWKTRNVSIETDVACFPGVPFFVHVGRSQS